MAPVGQRIIKCRENYQGIGKGKGKHQSSHSSYQKGMQGKGALGIRAAILAEPRSMVLESASRAYQRLAFEEPVEWNGTMYTKFTFRDGRVEYQAW